jgi:hypothetical protein
MKLEKLIRVLELLEEEEEEVEEEPIAEEGHGNLDYIRDFYLPRIGVKTMYDPGWERLRVLSMPKIGG